jgi:hypothetical protein
MMALLCLLRTFVNDRLAHIQGSLFRTLFLRQTNPFLRLLVENVVFNVVFSGLQSTLQFLVTRLSHLWRKRLNNAIATDYFSHMTYYKVIFFVFPFPLPVPLDFSPFTFCFLCIFFFLLLLASSSLPFFLLLPCIFFFLLFLAFFFSSLLFFFSPSSFFFWLVLFVVVTILPPSFSSWPLWTSAWRTRSRCW